MNFRDRGARIVTAPGIGARLDARLARVVAAPGRELSGLAFVAFRDGGIIHEAYFGARLQPGGPPVDRETRWRVASISKIVTGATALRLAGRGAFDIRRDVSDYLGFTLRNPTSPDRAITAETLASHTSGLRDAGFYTPPPGMALRDLFLPDGTGQCCGKAEDGPRFSPIRLDEPRFEYCNLGYGVLATAMESATGRTFDALARQEILEPLGIDGAFNINLLTDAGFAAVSPLYRKRSTEGGPWVPDGPWVPQTDDFRGARPRDPACKDPPAGATAADSRGGATAADSGGGATAAAGVNGAIHSPQGGLRICAPDLARLGCMLAGGGTVDVPGKGRVRLLDPSSMETMTEPRWRRRNGPSGGIANGEDPAGLARATGFALMKNAGTDGREDRFWGHHGDAYGFNGALLFDPAANEGYLYMIGGISTDPDSARHPVSRMAIWEHEIRLAAESALFRPARSAS